MKKMKNLFLLAAALLVFAACSETEEIPEFNDWEKRNTQFIDSIAKVARADKQGEWKIFLDRRIPDSTKVWDNDDYVYCRVLKAGDGTESPIYTDTVTLNYQGRLIPSRSYPDGYLFDYSYSGELDPDFDVPAQFLLSETVAGFYTAVEHMVAGTTKTSGDYWRVYIPANLGYGTEKYQNIPAYSTLIFDINLVSISSPGTATE